MELQKIYNNADNHEIASYVIYISDDDSDKHLYYDKELKHIVTPEDALIAFTKGITFFGSYEGELTEMYAKPIGMTKSSTPGDTGYKITILGGLDTSLVLMSYITDGVTSAS